MSYIYICICIYQGKKNFFSHLNSLSLSTQYTPPGTHERSDSSSEEKIESS